MILPKYPVYVPSKGRAATPLTARFLNRDQVPFHFVVEEPEADAYEKIKGDFGKLLVLPTVDQGLFNTRNWIKDHATAAGAKRHWQIDDNIRGCSRLYKKKKLPCQAGIALRVTEDFVDRYTNVATAGLQYNSFVPRGFVCPPFYLNSKVYSCSLVLNAIEQRWRLFYNDDVDICLQVLAAGYCTVTVNAFQIAKIGTMTAKGGNTPHYQDDGRLKMARSLERVWPGVVTPGRRFQRPQHKVKDSWRRFDNKLIRDESVQVEPSINEYGMTLKELNPVQSKLLKSIVDEWSEDHERTS